MKYITFIITLFLSLNIFSQERKKIDEPEYKKFVQQAEYIGKTIVDKNIITDVNNWYEGIDKENVLSDIQQLERDINNSELDVTYSLSTLNKNPLIYTLRFYNEPSKTEFGILFIRFKNRENNIVDDIRLADKTTMEGVEEEPIITICN